VRGETFRIKHLILIATLILATFSGCLSSGGDNDGLDDGIERSGWYVYVYDVDGNEKEIHVTSDPSKSDTDNDGLSDKEEYELFGKLNPRSVDTDNDGLTDYEEVKIYQTEPNKQDSEVWPDGLKDGIEVNGWNITVNGKVMRVSSDPTLYDTDGDGLSDYEEWQNLTDPSSKDTDSDGITDLVDLYPCKDLKINFILERIFLSEDYGKKAKVYFIIRPEGSDIKRTNFIDVTNGTELNLTDFVDTINPSDDKNLYPLEIQISAFDNNTQETTTEYVFGYGTVTVKTDKSLRMSGGTSSFELEFDPSEVEKTFNISGDDISISFKLRIKGD